MMYFRKFNFSNDSQLALIADGHDPATYLFRVNETVASPGSVKPTSPTISPAASMENLADGNEEKKEEHTSENGNGTGTAAGEAHDEPMESESATPAKDGGAENADNLDTSKELVIVDEPAADAAAPAADEEMLEDPLIDVPTETSAPAAAAAAKPAVTVTTSSAVKTPVQAPANDDKEKDTASRSIWVRGLTSATKAADLKVLCTQFGKVVRAKIYTSKKQTTSACYGYVTMADTAAAEKAATALHKTQYKGRTISVEKADRSKVPAVKSASAAAAPTKKDAAGDSTASAKRGESEKKTSDETSKSAKSASMAGEKSQSESKGGKRAGSTTSTTQSKRDDSRSDRKRDDKDARRSSNSERRDSGTRRVFAYTLQAGSQYMDIKLFLGFFMDHFFKLGNYQVLLVFASG
ncbi:hypothetical protein Y032_0105g3681 [Ancylostoma ceylanicum]|uniref:RRM domain-containing protein n=1 Tax=Ancylostoma ceylanicum TaxID=53326 RepID=A0A016TG36_9BILA|nr:hypothetical protein Y032_0105g3681 [Ancylostoma ceylanicum]